MNQNFRNDFPKLSVPFDFEPEFPEILVEWNAPIICLSRYFLFLAFTGIPENLCTICPLLQCQALQGNTSAKECSRLKIWKMAADFQNFYRYNVSLCSSVVLADVLEHNCNPAGENEFNEGKQCGCWLLVSLTKCGCCSSQTDEIVSSKKVNFPSRPIKRLALQEVVSHQIPYWYVPRSADPSPLASESSDQIIRFSLVRFLSGKKMQFHLSRKKKNYRKFHSNGKRSKTAWLGISWMAAMLC